MQKKQSVIIEFESSTEEQKFLNWALNPEKDNNKEILRARNLIKSKEQATTIELDGKTLVVVNDLRKKRIRNLSTLKSEL